MPAKKEGKETEKRKHRHTFGSAGGSRLMGEEAKKIMASFLRICDINFQSISSSSS